MELICLTAVQRVTWMAEIMLGFNISVVSDFIVSEKRGIDFLATVPRPFANLQKTFLFKY